MHSEPPNIDFICTSSLYHMHGPPSYCIVSNPRYHHDLSYTTTHPLTRVRKGGISITSRVTERETNELGMHYDGRTHQYTEGERAEIIGYD